MRARAGRVGVVLVLAAAVMCPLSAGATVTAKVPKPHKSIAKTATAFVDAIESGDCADQARILVHSIHRASGKLNTTPGPEDCTNLANYVANLKGLVIDRSQQYGTGALVEGHVANLHFLFAFALDIDGAWRLISYVPTTQQIIGTEPIAGAKQAAKSFVDAVRAKDCPAVWKSLNTESDYVTSNTGPDGESAYCKTFDDALATREGRAAQIAKSRHARLITFGGTSLYAYFGLDLPSGMFITILVAKNAVGDPAHAQPSVFEYPTARNPRH